MKETSSFSEREQLSASENQKLEFLNQIIEEHEQSDSDLTKQAISCHRTGRVVEVAPCGEEDHLTIRSASDQIELTVRITRKGPVLLFQGADVQLQGTKDVSISCDTFHVDAKRDIHIECQGDRLEKIKGHAATEAKSVGVRATLGGVTIDANDDVALTGERIFLNK
jgi:hypothetical protein